MARETRHFNPSIPAGTAQNSPVTVNLAMPFRIVSRIDWRVPVGPMGQMGWWLAMGGVTVLPLAPLTAVIANGEAGFWELHGFPDSGAWQFMGWNTGANPHSVYLEFSCDPPPPRPVKTGALPVTALMPSPDLSRSGPPVVNAR